MMLALVPSGVFAAGNVIDFDTFVKAVVSADGKYDGGDVTVKIVPESVDGTKEANPQIRFRARFSLTTPEN